ncbi:MULTISPECIES: recombinase family protein [unclassified Streptomyces]|uniref:recombinase family protein n=1 Tax=unclassified Streptomyces TaxID=2593676 RepID=UPI000C06FD09|nr:MULTISPECIES: recombinase family protein [unclassified Streptomyces]MYT98327.1 recombinase family protein [Streptomyces sp. SID8350]
MNSAPRNPLAGTIYETQTLRGVRCVRLSVLTDETTSPERQREADDKIAAELNIDFGSGDALREAVDLDVSASKIAPFDRPALGQWLARPDDYDVLVWWRFDRAIRSMSDMHDLAKWAKQHRKMLVFAEGIGGGKIVFDFRDPMDPTSELMMMMLAFAAQVESQSIKDRVTGAMAAIRKMPLRWRGARPPYGYMPAPMPKEHGGSGWTLIPDPDAVKVIERIVRELLEGLTVSAIAVGLNADRVPSPRDHWAVKKGREKGGRTGGVKGLVKDAFLWSPSVITRMLRNEALLGWKMHKGKPVRDDQGNPVMATAEPIMTREEFDRIGAVLDERSINNGDRTDTDALLLRVIHCDSCGARMYLNKQENKQRPTYKCNPYARGSKCEKSANIRGDWADDYVEAEFLRLVGSIQTTHVVVIPGYDPEPELRATREEFAIHQAKEGKQKSKSALAEWQKRYDALDTRMGHLESLEKRPEQRIVTPTGRTIADEWAAADTAGRRALLVEAGVRLDVRRGVRGGWRKLDTRRVTFSMSGELDPAAEALAGEASALESVARGDSPTEGASVRLVEPTTVAEPVRELVAA